MGTVPPTDDDVVATTLRAMMALEADLDRAVNGPEPSRANTQDIAREFRRMLNETVATVGVASAGPCFDPVTRVREKVLRVFGTSAWDDPQTAEKANRPLPPGLGPTIHGDEGKR